MNFYLLLKEYFAQFIILLQTIAHRQSWLSLTGHSIGMMGMLCVIIAYYGIEKGKYTRENLTYYVINLIGATLLMISLTIHFNLGSFVIEFFWIIISLQGVMRILKQRRKNKLLT